MTSFFKKILSGFTGSQEESPENSERLQEYEQIFKLAKTKHLSDEKKAELEALYVQLIKKSDNATSGQLQFLGLAEIKQKMGPKWARLQSKVYATAEDVIHRHISISDIHFLYKEDRYVIIFTQSTDEEINRKVATISDEIMQRLAELDEEELQALQIKQEIKKIDAETFLDTEFPDMLDFVFKQYNPGYQANSDLSTDVPMAQRVQLAEVSLGYNYLPLWDIEKKSFKYHLCLARETGNEKPVFDAYKSLFQGKSLAERTAIDIAVLEKVVDELEAMELSDRKGKLICPVQHETLYNFSSYDEYKTVCQMIPNNQRDSLIFLVTNSESFSLPAKDPYWFIPLIKDYCDGVSIEIPMRETMVYQGLKNSGATGLGVQLTKVFSDDGKNLDILINFNSQAKYFKMKKTFAFNVETIEIADKMARMGFNILGGSGITPIINNLETEAGQERREDLLNLAK